MILELFCLSTLTGLNEIELGPVQKCRESHWTYNTKETKQIKTGSSYPTSKSGFAYKQMDGFCCMYHYLHKHPTTVSRAEMSVLGCWTIKLYFTLKIPDLLVFIVSVTLVDLTT